MNILSNELEFNFLLIFLPITPPPIPPIIITININILISCISFFISVVSTLDI